MVCFDYAINPRKPVFIVDQVLRIESTYIHVLAKIVHNLLFFLSPRKMIATNVSTHDCACVEKLDVSIKTEFKKKVFLCFSQNRKNCVEVLKGHRRCAK